MKVLILSENLNAALAAVRPAMARRARLPILETVRLATVQGRLTVTATNLDTTVEAVAGCRVDVEGARCLNYRALVDLVKSLPPVVVQLESDGCHGANIEAARGAINVAGIDAADFPKIDHADGTPLAVHGIASAIRYVEACAASDDGRPVLNGVYLERDAHGVTLTTADGFRLASATLATRDAGGPNAVVPVEAMRIAAKAIKARKQQPEVSLTIDAKLATFEVGCNLRITTQLTQGTYPDYQRLIRPDAPTVVTANAKDLARVAKMAATAARDGSGIIRLTVRPGTLTVAAQADEIVRFAMDLDAETRIGQNGQDAIGKPVYLDRFAINSGYLQDVLATAGKTVTFGFHGQNTQCHVTTDGMPGSTTIMPMMTTWPADLPGAVAA